MKVRSLLGPLVLHRALIVPLHHLNELFILLFRTPWVPHHHSPSFSQRPSHFLTQPSQFRSQFLCYLWWLSIQFVPHRQIGLQVDHLELHFRYNYSNNNSNKKQLFEFVMAGMDVVVFFFVGGGGVYWAKLGSISVYIVWNYCCFVIMCDSLLAGPVCTWRYMWKIAD